MSGHCILGVCVSIVLLYSTECTVTVSEEGGKFLCGSTTKLKCKLDPYGGGMTWKLDGTIIAQCAFGSCNALGALPFGDVFTPYESNGTFFLDIGITHADNGTMYQCDDGTNQDQITVNIKVPPHTGSIIVSGTNLSVTAGCFYPASNGRMAIYCVTDGKEGLIKTVPMTAIGTGCAGDCAGPGIFKATGSATIDNSTGTSAYRVKVYLDGFPDNVYEPNDTSAIYDCDNSTSTTPTTTSITSTTNTTTPTTSPTTTSTMSTTTTATTTPIITPITTPGEQRENSTSTTPTTTSITLTTNTTTSTTSPTTTSTMSTTTTATTTLITTPITTPGEQRDKGTNNTTSVIWYSVGAISGFLILVLLSVYLVRRFRSKKADGETLDVTSRNDRAASEDPAVVVTDDFESVSDDQKPNLSTVDGVCNNGGSDDQKPNVSTVDGVCNNEGSVPNYEALKMENRDVSNYSVLVDLTSDRLQNNDEYENMKL